MKSLSLFFLMLLVPALAAADSVTVTGGKQDATNVVVTTDTEFAFDITANDVKTFAQRSGKKSLIVLPVVKAGESITIKPWVPKKGDPAPGQPAMFKFVEKAGEYVDVNFESKPVLRFVNKPHDASTADSHYMTFKPFHQVFDPATGKTLLTSGAHPNTKEFLYPHHRGLFFGFNRISYGDKQTADIWHGTDKVYSTCNKMISTEEGPVFARHKAAISWHGKDDKAFANEEREVTVYNLPGGTLIDWNTTLVTDFPKVRLDGDPQHAGFHFRANMEVATNIEAEKALAKKENRPVKPADTYYLRPDGKGKPGETRNWDAKGKNDKAVNLPWNAMSCVIGEKRYTVLRINHPDNPGEKRGSERDYGRFGDYFEYDLTPKTPLKLKYRVWVQLGEMTVPQCEAMANGFVNPPEVKGK